MAFKESMICLVYNSTSLWQEGGINEIVDNSKATALPYPSRSDSEALDHSKWHLIQCKGEEIGVLERLLEDGKENDEI